MWEYKFGIIAIFGCMWKKSEAFQLNANSPFPAGQTL